MPKPKFIDHKVIKAALLKARALERKHIVTKEELTKQDKQFLKDAKKAFSFLEKISKKK
tara:strand:+ start:4266 stop:4442 length:177 start_codon:yes stop_codon:yes gene_type:complete